MDHSSIQPNACPSAWFEYGGRWIKTTPFIRLSITYQAHLIGDRELVEKHLTLVKVLRNGKLAGLISMGDVIKHRLEDLELEASVLHEVYIASH